MSSYISIYVKNKKGAFTELDTWSRSSVGYQVLEDIARYEDKIPMDRSIFNSIESKVLRLVDENKQTIEKYKEIIDKISTNTNISEAIKIIEGYYTSIDQYNEENQSYEYFIQEIRAMSVMYESGRFSNEDRFWLAFECGDLEEGDSEEENIV